METFEVIFLISGIAITVSQIYVLKAHFKYKELVCIENNIKELVDSGFFDSTIFSVSKFNYWFKNNKDKSLYAHAGIYLRTDKLSKSYINDYIKVLTKGLLSEKDFSETVIFKFEDKIRKDWMKQLQS